MPGAANSEAIAWSVERSEGLLEQLRERVQALRARDVRTLRTMLDAIQWTTLQGDKVAFAVRKAEYLIMTGLFSVAAALTTLIAVMTV